MKLRRHDKIIEIINNYTIETQQELLEKLEECGFNAAQATISRDIRELKLYKSIDKNGKLRYFSGEEKPLLVSGKLERVFKDSVISIDYAQNIVVIKTFTGMAMAVASAVDAMKNIEILGSIAGDDTVFCVVRSLEKAVELKDSFEAIMEN